jgi:hypothetical protein
LDVTGVCDSGAGDFVIGIGMTCPTMHSSVREDLARWKDSLQGTTKLNVVVAVDAVGV